MNRELQLLLTLTPGVIFRSPRLPVKFPIPRDDRPATLTMPTDPVDTLQVGDWARITKGPYRGDLGLVAEVGEWIKLLVVPRLRPSFISRDLSKKRKRSEPIPPPRPMLFDPISFAADRGVKLTETKPHLYRYRTYFFEHGLLLKDFDRRAVSSKFVFMPFFLSSLMHQSDHPKIRRAIFPPPSEWEFFEGEEISIVESGIVKSSSIFFEKGHLKKNGIIKVVEGQLLEVELTNGEGLIRIPWDAARKQHKIGEFVQVSHGPHQGRCGWVVLASDDEITCTEELPSQNEESVPILDVRITVHRSNNLPTYLIKQEFVVHPNSAKSTDVPFHHSAKRPNIFDKPCLDQPQPKLTPEDNKPLRVPWKGVAIIIVGHKEFKGRIGTVRDVHINRNTSSGLEVDVELDTFSLYNSAIRKCFDYDDVLERRFLMLLLPFPPH